jgi:hypothetical protein
MIKIMLKNKLLKVLWILNQLGFNPLIFFRSVKRFPLFYKEYLLFKKQLKGGTTILIKPCLGDFNEEGGATDTEYFWQDLIVAQLIFKNQPNNHVDIGSRVDGFVSHVAAYRDIEVMDIRPLKRSIPGVRFIQADLMDETSLYSKKDGYCDSLSCLHALEHFGLGRYGDPVDALGYEKGFVNMAKLLKKEGVFYLSIPIGKNRVEFNANRVFDPRTILELAEINDLSLKSITTISNFGDIDDIKVNTKSILKLSEKNYCLGLFIFSKD